MGQQLFHETLQRFAELSSDLCFANLESKEDNVPFSLILCCVFKAHKFKPLYVFALFDISGPYGTIFRSSYTQFCKITKYKLIKGNGVSGLKNKSLLKKLWMGSGLLLGFSLKDHCPVSSASFFGNWADLRTQFRMLSLGFISSVFHLCVLGLIYLVIIVWIAINRVFD